MSEAELDNDLNREKDIVNSKIEVINESLNSLGIYSENLSEPSFKTKYIPPYIMQMKKIMVKWRLVQFSVE